MAVEIRLRATGLVTHVPPLPETPPCHANVPLSVIDFTYADDTVVVEEDKEPKALLQKVARCQAGAVATGAPR